MLTLKWSGTEDEYHFRFGGNGYGPAAYLYTPQLIQTILTVCGLRQFYPPPGGGRGDDNVTCPSLPADPYDCRLPQLTERNAERRPSFDPMSKCQGLRQIIDSGLKNIEAKRGGKPWTIPEGLKTSNDFCPLQ